MPIDLHRIIAKSSKPSVESLLDSAKAGLLAELTPELQVKAWALMVRSAQLLPTEPLANVSVTHLFPLASRFFGEPVNQATYDTAKRALDGDRINFMAAVRATEPTAEEKQNYKTLWE